MLVAGGAGFVGSAVVRHLVSRGVTPVVYDNFLHGVREHVALPDVRLPVLQHDATDAWNLARAMREHGIEYVIDCVGDTYVPSAYEVPWRFFSSNLEATYHVLMAAEQCGVRRVLYVSSTEVYGDCTLPQIDEEAPLNPVNTYAVSKMAADRLCHTLFLERRIPVVIARIFNCYGPRETHAYIVPEIISQLHQGPVVRLGNVRAERDLTYVDDTARALVAVLESDAPDGDVVNVGSGVCHRVDWLVERLARICGRHDWQIVVDESRLRRRDIDRFCCDNRKLRSLTGWTPEVGIEEGLRRTVAWFREHGGRWAWEESSADMTAGV